MKAKKRTLADTSAAVTRFVDAARRGMERAVDPNRVGVLRLASERGAVRPTELATELRVNPSSITRHVQALHALGHVAVSGDPADRRAYLVEITDQGRDELQALDRQGLDVFSAVVGDWSDEDLRQLTTLLDRMVDTWARAEHTRPASGHRTPGESAPWWAGS